jgi:hypothetical protein
MVLWIIAFVMLVLIIALAIAAVVVLGMLPGKIARRRNHPQAQAINVLSWAGLLLSFGVLWVVALAWAYVQLLRRPESESPSAPSSQLPAA